MDSIKIIQPTPAEIKKKRLDAGLTLQEAAELIHVTMQGFAKYETDNPKIKRQMHLAFWELFCLKVKELGD